MKKIILAIALLASAGFGAFAQEKSAADLKKAVEKAEAVAADAKKGTKVATWLKLGQAWLNAYNQPTANVVGGTKAELALTMGSEKPRSSEVVTLNGNEYEKVVYANKNLYFDMAGRLQFIEVTKPVYKDQDALAKALEAYKKASEVDAKGSKTKDISAAIKSISEKYYSDAFVAYQLGDKAKAAECFEASSDAAATAPYNTPDWSAVYNAGVMSLENKDIEKARSCFLKALENGYEQEGSVYANLSEVSFAAKDTLAARKYLEDGFGKYPENVQVMTSLINLYIATKEDPKKLIELLDLAKKQMPDNPSLYYVEGDIWAKLKEFDNAVAAYNKCAEVNPKYEMGYYGQGVMWYNMALEIQEEANALPYSEYKKYDALQEELAATLKKCLNPFETAFNVSENDAVKQSAADYLKRIYFIFRNESAENKANYEKYEAYLQGAK